MATKSTVFCGVFIAKPKYCKPAPCDIKRGIKRVALHDHTVIQACSTHRAMINNGKVLPLAKDKR